MDLSISQFISIKPGVGARGRGSASPTGQCVRWDRDRDHSTDNTVERYTKLVSTVNRLSTNGFCSWPFVHPRIGPWGNGYTFPGSPECPLLGYIQSNGRMYTPTSPKVHCFQGPRHCFQGPRHCFMDPRHCFMDPRHCFMEPGIDLWSQALIYGARH